MGEVSTKDEKKFKREYKKFRRDTFIKLIINFILQFIGIAALITSLIIVQKRVVTKNQEANLSNKLDEVVNILVDTTVEKEEVIEEFDDFYISKADTISMYLQAENDVLEKAINSTDSDTDPGKIALSQMCAQNKFDLTSVIFCHVNDWATLDISSRIYLRETNQVITDLTSIGFRLDEVASIALNPSRTAIKDDIKPFIFNHIANEGEHIVPDYISIGTQEDQRYIYAYFGSKIDNDTIVLLGVDPMPIYNNVKNLVSLNYILDDFVVSDGGQIMAVDSGGTIIYSGVSNQIGKTITDAGMNENILNESSYVGWIDVFGKRMYSSSLKLTEDIVKNIVESKYSDIDISTTSITNSVMSSFNDLSIVIAAISEEVINQKASFMCVVGGITFTFVAIVEISYCLFVRKELIFSGKHNIKKLSKILYCDTKAARRVAPVGIVGVIIVMLLTSFASVLYALSNQIDTNKSYLLEVNNVIETNKAQSEQLTEAIDNLYLNKMTILKHTLDSNDSICRMFIDSNNKTVLTKRSDLSIETLNVNMNYLQKLAKKIDVRNIYLFNTLGESIATSNTYQNFVLSSDEKAQSFPFWEIIENKRTYYIQEAMTDDLGQSSQYVGYALQRFYQGSDGVYSYETVGLIQIEVDPNDYIEKLSATSIGSVLKGLKFGENGFAFAIDKATRTIAYFPEVSTTYSVIGKKASDFGIPESAYSDGFFSKVKMDTTDYWISTVEFDDYYVYVAIPNEEIMGSIPASMYAIGIVSIVILCLFIFINVFSIKDETEYYELLKKDTTMVSVTLENGRKVKVPVLSSRWGYSPLKWEAKSATQKLGSIVKFYFFLLGILLVLLMFTSLGGSLSIVSYISENKFVKGINLFAFTNTLVYGIMILVASVFIRTIIAIFLRNADTRVQTVGRLVSNIVKYVAIIWALFRCLSTFGVDTTTLLTGAGILSVIIGLGSQQLIQDILAGLFIVFEGEFRVGDIVTIGDWRGTVLEIGLRTTKIESPGKDIKILSNSSISGVINMTKEYSFALCDVGIEYGESLERVEAVLAKELPLIADRLPSIKDGPFYKGVSSLGDSAVVLRIIAACEENDRLTLMRDLNREIKLIFDRNNINIPFNQITISKLKEEDIEATAKQKKIAKEFVEEQKEVAEGKGEINEEK
jgi:small-conductance mechanosensitive channel